MHEYELSEEQQLIQKTVRQIGDEKFRPGAKKADKDREPPVKNLKVLAENGYTGIFLPEEYGGSNLGILEMVLIVEQVARSCANTAILLGCTDGATPRAISHLGTKEQKEKYLPKFAKAELLAGWSMSEPDAGSDVGNVKTRAIKKGDQYVINGTKLWCTAAQVADVFLILVRLNDDPGMKGVGGILVDRGTPGFTIGSHIELLGLRGTGMAELVFTDCAVPAENVIVPAGKIKDILAVLDADRITGNPPVCLGVAGAALDAAVKFTGERIQFGKPLSDNQGLQWKLADMAIELEAARALLYRTAARADAGKATMFDVSSSKVFVNEMAVRVTNQAVQLAGASGLSEEMPFERYLRDVRGMSIGYGTTEIHRNTIARELISGRYRP